MGQTCPTGGYRAVVKTSPAATPLDSAKDVRKVVAAGDGLMRCLPPPVKLSCSHALARPILLGVTQRAPSGRDAAKRLILRALSRTPHVASLHSDGEILPQTVGRDMSRPVAVTMGNVLAVRGLSRT